jgi:hypothetical protein
MQTTQFFRRTILILPLLFLQFGCNSADAKKIGNALHDVQLTVSTLRTTVHTANTSSPQLISDSNALAVYQICDKIDLAGIQADALTLKYSQLPAGSKPQLAALVNPILQAVNDSIATGLVPITNPATKAKIQTALETIRSGLLIVQSVVGS